MISTEIKKNIKPSIILMFLAYCLPACISGEITSDGCTGSIFVAVQISETNETFGTTIDPTENTYTIQVPLGYLGKESTVFATCNNDPFSRPAGCYLAIGDYWGYYGGGYGESFQIKINIDNININLNNKITHSVSGEIVCDEYDGTGCLDVSVWDELPSNGSIENLISAIGCYLPEKPGPYTVLLSNADGEDTLWTFGSWDVDCSGGTPNRLDYTGEYPDNPFSLASGETTGIEFDVCQKQEQ